MNDITKQIVVGWIITALALAGFGYGLYAVNKKTQDTFGAFLRTALVTQGGTQFASTTENALIASGTTTSAALVATGTPAVDQIHATGTVANNWGNGATSTFAGGLSVLAGGSFAHVDLASCDTVDTDSNGFFACGTDANTGRDPNVILTDGLSTTMFRASTTGFPWQFPDGFISASSTVDSTLSVTGHFAASSTVNIVGTTTIDGRLSIATGTPYTTSMLNIEINDPASHGLIIQGTINQDAHLFMLRNNAGKRLFFVEDSGETEIIHVATENGDHTLHLETDVAGFGDVVGIFNDFDAGTMAAGEDGSGLLITVDRTNTTGGDIHGLLVFTTAAGSAEVIGLELGVGVFPIRHNSGTFGDMDACTSPHPGTDILSSCTDTGTDATLFENNGDQLTIGDAAQFTSIDVSLATESSKNIDAKFEFSSGTGTFTEFSPSDGTNGFQDTSVIAWELTDIPSWATGTSSRFFIRITRTRVGNIATPPVEDKLQISAVTEFLWDDLGNTNVNVLNASSTHLVDGLSTLTGFISTASSTITGTLTLDAALSASSTAVFGGNFAVDSLTSAMIITNAVGQFAEYAGTSCTNQFVRSLSVLGAATCASVDLANDVTGTLATGNGGTGATSLDDILGTSNEIDVSAGANTIIGGDVTLTISDTLDLGGNTSVEIPNATGNTVDAIGEIALDTSGNQLIIATSTTEAEVFARALNRLYAWSLASTSPYLHAGETQPIPPEVDGYTVYHVQCSVWSGTSVVINFTDGGGNDTNAITCTTATSTLHGIVTNNVFTAGEGMSMEVGTITGTVEALNISVFGIWTRE